MRRSARDVTRIGLSALGITSMTVSVVLAFTGTAVAVTAHGASPDTFRGQPAAVVTDPENAGVSRGGELHSLPDPLPSTGGTQPTTTSVPGLSSLTTAGDDGPPATDAATGRRDLFGALGFAPGVSSAADSAPAARLAPSHGLTQGHYAAPTRTPNGFIDIQGTLDGIVLRGSRVYQYLLYSRSGYDSAKDWATLPAFLVGARARGVTVHVTLTPPASTSSSRRRCTADQLLPYRGRYDLWMAQIARVARTHPNLTAVVMDDYAYSSTNRPASECRSFAPDTLGRWNKILTGGAHRRLRVIPVMYLADMVGPYSTYASIAGQAPAVVWPFTSIGTPNMRAQYASIRKAYPKVAIFIMVYAAPFRGTDPTPNTVRTELAVARALRPAGVLLYQQPLG